jgi:hypothetical protein
VLAAGGLAVLAGLRGTPPPTPNPPGTFAFAALGDAPYYPREVLQYRLVRKALAAHDLAWVLHVGDIFGRPCSDSHYDKVRRVLDALPHPVVYTPGDNEWADCWERGSGGFAPRERLERIRQTFFAGPRALGRRARPLLRQGGQGAFPEFVENARWSHAGFVFATVHLVGSRNALEPFPGRTREDDAEVRRRTEAAAAWLGEAFAQARASRAAGVVIALHGDPPFAAAPGRPERQPFEPFATALAREVEQFPGPVLAIHGDNHEYVVDQPLVRPSTGAPFSNFTRLEVPGSPDVGWVRVVVSPGTPSPFAFERHVVPFWKYW